MRWDVVNGTLNDDRTSIVTHIHLPNPSWLIWQTDLVSSWVNDCLIHIPCSYLGVYSWEKSSIPYNEEEYRGTIWEATTWLPLKVKGVHQGYDFTSSYPTEVRDKNMKKNSFGRVNESAQILHNHKENHQKTKPRYCSCLSSLRYTTTMQETCWLNLKNVGFMNEFDWLQIIEPKIASVSDKFRWCLYVPVRLPSLCTTLLSKYHKIIRSICLVPHPFLLVLCACVWALTFFGCLFVSLFVCMSLCKIHLRKRNNQWRKLCKL